MPAKQVRRITNPHKLTAEEADETRLLRELVEKDKEEILAEGRRFLAEKRSAMPSGGEPRRSAR